MAWCILEARIPSMCQGLTLCLSVLRRQPRRDSFRAYLAKIAIREAIELDPARPPP
jgi:hypothetical protein